MRSFQFFILSLFCLSSVAQNSVTISGYVKDKTTGEALNGVFISIKGVKEASSSNAYGYFVCRVIPGNYWIQFSYIGYETDSQYITVSAAKVLNIEMNPSSKELGRVSVSGQKRNKNVEKLEMSTIQLNAATIKKIPAVMGEVDLVKTIQLLPGVSTVGEGATGFNVRGGSVDQNLILLDEAPIYNSSHALGFFSVFNPDAVKDVKLIKGGIPANYGGRLSSVLDIQMKEGNKKKLSGSGGIGTIFSRLTIEGPIKKDKVSAMVAFRRSYADLFFPLANNDLLKESALNFYDLNMKVNAMIDKKNHLYFSGYLGKDNFRFAELFGTSWGNQNATLRWNHLFGPRLFSNNSFIFSNYRYELGSPSGPFAFKWVSNIKFYNVKSDYSFFLNSNHTLLFGMQSIFYTINPGGTEQVKGNSSSNIINVKLDNKYSIEPNFYINDEHRINSKLSMQYGLRYNGFASIGAAKVYIYKNPDNRLVREIIDSNIYSNGELMNYHHGLEPRFSFKFTLDKNSSLKGSYNRTRQNIHLVTQTAAASPLDIYLPSDKYFLPQIADQGTLGYFRNFKNNVFETSFEIYYKKFNNLIDFRDGATLIGNPYIETEMLRGTGYSYGTELYIRKSEGRLTGWISYTWSRTRRTVAGINEGKEYAAPYDKTHNANITASYEINKRLSVSGTFVYSTGVPYTAPAGKFAFQGWILADVSGRNSLRVPDYHRMDIGITYKGKKKKWHQGEWVLSAYNVYARRNAYSVYFRQNPQNPAQTEAVRVAVFGTVIPSLTYNFNF